MKRNLLSTLGICKKAGKLAEGFEPVAEAAKAGEACLIVTANDLSPKSEKEIARVAAACGVQHLPIDAAMDELHAALGKRVGIAAVLDQGLAQTIRNKAEKLAIANNGIANNAIANDGIANGVSQEETAEKTK